MTANALQTLLAELVHGPPRPFGWLLDAGDTGLLGTLRAISASQASTIAPGGTTVAAQTRHIMYHLELLNRFAAGEENPFATADWSEAWKHPAVTEAEWAALQEGLEAASAAWITAVKQAGDWDDSARTGAIGSAVHIGHHLGAIRQMVKTISA